MNDNKKWLGNMSKDELRESYAKAKRQEVVDAFNRLSREIQKDLPYYRQTTSQFSEATESDKMDYMTRKMMYGDAETEEAIKNLIEAIINEHESVNIK